MRILLASLVVLVACSKDKEAKSDDPLAGVEEEAAVEFARKQLPDIDAKLASSDPGAVSGACSVLKADLPKIRTADKKLAETIEQRCGKDYQIRSFTVYVEKLEAERATDPTGSLRCSSLDIYYKGVKEIGADSDPTVVKMMERYNTVCPKK